jgi:hypothetical protein
VGNVIEGRKPALFFQVVEPFPASGIGIGKLESPSLPGIEKVTLPVGGIKLIKDLCIKSCAYY